MRFLKKYPIKLLAFVLVPCLLTGMLCACQSPTVAAPFGTTAVYTPRFTITDADTDVSIENPVTIQLEEKLSLCSITKPGTYLLRGKMSGQILVDAQDQVVHLIFAGIEVVSTDGPALQINSAAKVIITLQDGTENTLRDFPTYPKGSQENACIYSVSDLTINGTGSLTVSGYFEDAIHVKDVLKLLGGNIFVQAKRDAIQGNDGIVVNCQSLTVQSERHGLYTKRTGNPPKGSIEICGGNHSVIAGGYGISCVGDLYIDQCTVRTTGVLGKYRVDGETLIAEGCDG